MPKRKTYGYLLLVFLVISGLAGTPTNDVLSKKERKSAADYMKETKIELFKSLDGLSVKQINYKPDAETLSIKECVFHLAEAEKIFWSMLEKSMDSPSNTKRKDDLKFSDDEVIEMAEKNNTETKALISNLRSSNSYKNLDKALSDFKMNRASHIKYIKLTSEDLRDHIVEMPFGTLDCYQLCLMISSYTREHINLLNELRSREDFPE